MPEIYQEDGTSFFVSEDTLKDMFQEVFDRYPSIDREKYFKNLWESIEQKNELSYDEFVHLTVGRALDFVDVMSYEWSYIASYAHLLSLKNQYERFHMMKPYDDLYSHIQNLIRIGIYKKELLEIYSVSDIRELEKEIRPERDYVFDYVGLITMIESYLAKNPSNNHVIELPQHRFMIIAMWLMSQEPYEKRVELIKKAYHVLSKRWMTVATPTFANAGKTHGQLSSCFIDTVHDDLVGIYDSNTDVARLSKGGGGIGVYLGKIRALGSDIKNHLGASSGVIPWMKQLNNTAISVDQLGQRKGAIAPYLDIWHLDIEMYLEVKLNNGDERFRTHDLSPGVCVPDLFMERVRDRGDWYLFDPYEVRRVFGKSLEDFYDEEKGKGTFREFYEEVCKAAEEGKLRSTLWKKVRAIDLMKKILVSQFETGYPYMFYRDEANRMNPNKHMGMIYSSNLCTEIHQNMSPTYVVEEVLTEDGKIIITKQPGDFVVCNLSSISLAPVVTGDHLEELIPIQVRMLDNVIDLNSIEVLQARYTNKRYRAIGLGTFGWHHLLALQGIEWESEEAVEYADYLYEKIAYEVIKASHELALEKGPYPLFEGSEWNTGEYFVRRGYVDRDEDGNIVSIEGKEHWYELCLKVMKDGIRNGYLMAVAPNGTTALVAGSTKSIDPIFNLIYDEEKQAYRVPVVAPDLTPETYPYYAKNAYQIDQKWSIKQNARRQKHIDQGISFNIYILPDTKASELLSLHMMAWENGFKSTYYVYSKSVDLEDCEWCAS